MADIVLTDINPRIQYTANGLTAVFAYPFPIYANTDLIVYRTPVGTTALDIANVLVYVVNYTVANNAAPAVGGSITLNVLPTAGDIITIIRNMPENRLVNYLDGGQWSATQFNTDFDRTVMMAQTNTMFERVIAPHYNTSSNINTNATPGLTSGCDTFLPILPANTIWMKNNANTAIQAVSIGTIGAGGGVVLPSIPNTIPFFTNNVGVIQSSGITWTGNNVLTSILPNIGFQFLVNGAGLFQIGTLSYPRASVANGYVMTDNGAGVLSLQPPLATTTTGNNMLINGSMQIWRRGADGAAVMAVPAATNAYTADRWQLSTQIGQACTVTQTQGAPFGFYLARVQRNAGQIGVLPIRFATTMTIDMTVGAPNNPLTLSFKAHSGANFSAAGGILNIQVITGTGNTDTGVFSGFTGAAIAFNANQAITPVLTNYNFTTPAIAANVTQIAVLFGFTPVGAAGANDYFEITDVQLEIGAFQTAFERKPYAQEQFECQYFYDKSFQYGLAPATAVGTGTSEEFFICTSAGATANYSQTVHFGRTMLSEAGTTILYNPANANNQVYNATIAADCSGSSSATHARGFAIGTTGNAGGAVGNILSFHWTIDVDLV